jgi:hypothetical protein
LFPDCFVQKANSCWKIIRRDSCFHVVWFCCQQMYRVVNAKFILHHCALLHKTWKQILFFFVKKDLFVL